MKYFTVFLFLIPLLAGAQEKPLIAEGASPHLYISHTLIPKENYYSLGRLYNVSPKELAPYNNLAFEKGLSVGQTIRIPLSEVNFLQSGNAGPEEVLVPVYHTVGEKEGLYRISLNHNKVPVETLRQWNKFPGSTVASGMRMIVGFLKVKKEQSALASGAKDPSLVTMTKNDPVPAVKKTKNPGPPNIYDKNGPPTKNPDKEKEQVVVITPKSDPPKPLNDNSSLPSETMKGTGDNFNGGIFRKMYKDINVVNENGQAGVFKSSSGWGDGKYYCLHNGAQPGSIIKVTNTGTGKFIYAKVLDNIPDIKQNQGLIIRISNAAADILGAGENKFDCSLSYSK